MIKPILCLPVCAAALLAAATAFWDAKPFASWSNAEVKQMMSNSPWAHEVPIPDPSQGWQSGATIGGGKGGRGAVSIPAGGVGSSKLKVTVFWESALPGRQALVRFKFGADGVDSREARSYLEADEGNYIIVVTGLPAVLIKQDKVRDLDRLRDGLAAKTSLTVKGHPAERPTKADMVQDGKALGMYFEFPRTMGIAATDKEVEFSTKVDDVEIKTSFHPAEMVFGGKLEL